MNFLDLKSSIWTTAHAHSFAQGNLSSPKTIVVQNHSTHIFTFYFLCVYYDTYPTRNLIRRSQELILVVLSCSWVCFEGWRNHFWSEHIVPMTLLLGLDLAMIRCVKKKKRNNFFASPKIKSLLTLKHPFDFINKTYQKAYKLWLDGLFLLFYKESEMRWRIWQGKIHFSNPCLMVHKYLIRLVCHLTD